MLEADKLEGKFLILIRKIVYHGKARQIIMSWDAPNKLI